MSAHRSIGRQQAPIVDDKAQGCEYGKKFKEGHAMVLTVFVAIATFWHIVAVATTMNS